MWLYFCKSVLTLLVGLSFGLYRIQLRWVSRSPFSLCLLIFFLSYPFVYVPSPHGPSSILPLFHGPRLHPRWQWSVLMFYRECIYDTNKPLLFLLIVSQHVGVMLTDSLPFRKDNRKEWRGRRYWKLHPARETVPNDVLLLSFFIRTMTGSNTFKCLLSPSLVQAHC